MSESESKDKFEKLKLFLLKIYNLNLSKYLINILPFIAITFFPNFSSILKPSLIDLLNNISLGFSTEILSKEILSVKDKKKIEEICNKLEDLKSKNSEINESILEFTRSFINSNTFNKLIENNEILINLIKNLNNEIYRKLSELSDEINFIRDNNIPKIENLLLRYSKNEATFLRTEGFLWVDFENDYVYKPPIVDEIINRLENENIIFIKGPPASGKSTILRYVGYLLRKDKNYDVYYIDLKSLTREKILEIYKIRHGVLIIEDAHLYVNLVEDVINNLNAKLLISSRDIDIERTQEFGPTRESRFSDYLKNAIVVKPKDEAEKIIEKLEEKEEKLPQEIKRELARNSLWVLRWQLDTYKKDKRIDKEYVYKNIRNYLKTLPYVKNSDDIFLLLSVFYKYEIPVRKSYLIEFLEIDGEAIKNLDKINEIIILENNGKTYLGLHHSELAKLYFETFIYFKDEALKVKKNINNLIKELKIENYRIDNEKLNYDISILIDYLIKYPEEFTLLVKTMYYNNAEFIEYFFIYLLKIEDIIKSKEIFKKLIEKLDEIPFDFYIFINTNYKMFNKLFNLIEMDVFEKKIREWRDPWSIGELICNLNYAGYKGLTYLLERIEVEVFEEKIRRWDNPWSIGYLIWSLKNADYKGYNNLIKRIEVEVFEEKIRRWEDSESIGELIKYLKIVNYKGLDKIKVEVFEDKIREWNDLDSIIDLIENLKYTKYKNLNKIKVEIFEEKIKKWDNVLNINELIKNLKLIKYKNLNNLLERIEVEVFEEKIRRWEDSESIGELIKYLKIVNYKGLDKIKVEVFEDKIREWKNPWNIGKLIITLNEINYKNFKKLMNNINAKFFEQLIKTSINSLPYRSYAGIRFLEEILLKVNYKYINELKENLKKKNLWFVEEN